LFYLIIKRHVNNLAVISLEGQLKLPIPAALIKGVSTATESTISRRT